MRILFVLSSLAVFAGCAMPDALDSTFGPDGRTVREAIADFPEGVRRDFPLVERRCGRCHTLNRPFAAHLPEGAWRPKVRKMARKPGAGITEEEEERIARFLEHFFQERRRSRAGSGGEDR